MPIKNPRPPGSLRSGWCGFCFARPATRSLGGVFGWCDFCDVEYVAKSNVAETPLEAPEDD